MSRQNIRDYELSIWTLQDSFITVLGTADVAHKRQLIGPKMKISTDGTQSLEFSIPIKYREGNELVDNPLWYNLVNGTIIVDLRKIKVIFNKQDAAKRRIYEFVINKVTEEHSGGQLIAKIEGEGLAFQELGHTGYKLTFNQETFELEYAEWFEGYEEGKNNKNAEPVATIDYWAKKVFDKTNWNYEVRMDWSGYDGITNNALRTKDDRQPNKIYEDEYISSWETSENGTNIVPSAWEKFTEKARIIDVEKSNRYNITQDIAEAFGVFCKYEYEYDENYHIIGRKCIFYNNFFDEAAGKIDINYPYDMSSVSREMDSADLVTKMFVVPLDDDSQPSGEINIANEPANFAMEDYILNFEYLHLIGTISEEQYESVSGFNTSMAIINRALIPYSNRLSEVARELTNQKQEEATQHNKQVAAEERIKEANAYISSLIGKDEILSKTASTPDSAIFIEDGAGGYYLNIHQGGVLYDDNFKIYGRLSKGSVVKDTEIKIDKSRHQTERDSCGNLIRIKNFTSADFTIKEEKDKLEPGSLKCYLTYNYQPALQYKNIINTYTVVLNQTSTAEQAATAQIKLLEEEQKTLEETINSLLDQKSENIAAFERSMGPALKEGSWTPDDYRDYGNKYIETGNFEDLTLSEHLSFIWDEELFEGEQKDYREEGPEQTAGYYPVIELPTSLLSSDHLKDLHFFYQNKGGADLSLIINSTMFYAYGKVGNSVKPLIILNGCINDLDKTKPYSLGYVYTDLTGAGATNIKTMPLVSTGINFLNETQYKLVYPRIRFNSEKLKVSEDNLKVMANGTKIEKYSHYILTYRALTPYITIKPEELVLIGQNTPIAINFTLSNASLSLYLDALQVSQENAFPQVSYTVKVENSSADFLCTDYTALGRLVNINDFDLHFENVQGYVSEIELVLDKPWEDVLTIQNYKNKFEDLFQRIVASSEQMKTNAIGYDRAASAITSSGGIVSSYVQNALNQVDLNYQFMNGTLTIDEINGIWARSDGGVVALRGGGLFTSNQRDSFGNWVWNTAITPAGINASLITTGQLNTDVIKIYAGDNVAFQMNNMGLYAYRKTEDGITPYEYVVHNGEGLFLTNEQPKTDDNDNITYDVLQRVSITWDGLTIRNMNNEKVFFADDAGNLTLAGTVKANAGDIGGWKIEENQLSSTVTYVDVNTEQEGIASVIGLNSKGKGEVTVQGANGQSETTYDNVLWIASDKYDNEYGYFRVDSNGDVYANNILANKVIAMDSDGNKTDLNNAIKHLDVETLMGDIFYYESDRPIGSDILRYVLRPLNGLKVERTMLDSAPEAGADGYETSGYTVEYLKSQSGDTEVWEFITTSEADKKLLELTSSNYLTFTVHRAIIDLAIDNVVTLRFTGYEKGAYVGYSKLAPVYRNIDTSGGISCVIETNNGNLFRTIHASAELTCRVYDETGELDATNVEENQIYTYAWTRYNKFGEPLSFSKNDETDLIRYGKTITVTNADINAQATYFCGISLKS